MSRIVVLGANGQVGAEVCLLLARRGADVVPVCRNRLGSAYLRSMGLACRHGSVGDPAQAPGLVGDAAVVAHLALAVGRPAEARAANRAVTTQAVLASPPGTRIVYFSTQSVYGDPRPGRRIRWRTAYGREKRAGEKEALRAGRRAGKPVTVLRLGHVAGELQGISRLLRRALAEGPVGVHAGGGLSSNVVHVVTIVDALLAASRGSLPRGVHDLMNVPPWTWRQALEHEAARAGVVPRLVPLAPPARRSLASRLLGPRTREAGQRLLAVLPASWGRRAQAAWFVRQAAAQVAALTPVPFVHEASDWIDLGRRYVPGLTPTSVLLAEPSSVPAPVGPPFPDDLPPAP